MAAAPEQLELDAARSQTETLYRQHGAAVFGICRAVLRDRGEAEDATQQVFLSAHRALVGGAVPREPLAWLATIARRECWARNGVGAGAAEPETGLTAPDASTEAIRNFEIVALWTAIAELPPAQREALLLREIRGLSYVQLGRELSLTPPATRSLLARARRRIRLRLRDLHAALGSASWIEQLARLFAGGGSPAAPAARAAALGVGAVAIAGGAIVTPSALQHHVRRPLAVATVARPVHAARRPSRPAVRADPVRAVVAHGTTAAATPRTGHGPGRTARVEHRGPVRARSDGNVEHRGSSASRSESHDDRGTPVISRGEGSSGEEVAGVSSTPAGVSAPSNGDPQTSGSDSHGDTTSVPTATTPTVAFGTSGHEGEGGGEAFVGSGTSSGGGRRDGGGSGHGGDVASGGGSDDPH